MAELTKREGGPTRWEHRKIPVTKAAKGEGPTHTVDLFRGDYAKTQEDPSRGWREEPRGQWAQTTQSRVFFSSQLWNAHPCGTEALWGFIHVGV